VCLDIAGNVTAGTGHTNAGIGLRKQGTVSTTNGFGVEGMAATASPGVEQFVGNTGQNPGSENGTAGDGSVNGVLLISAASGFSNCAAAPALNRPASPLDVARANVFRTSPLSAWSHLQTDVSSAFEPAALAVGPLSRSFVGTSIPARRTAATALQRLQPLRRRPWRSLEV
jgi:hypothetical protein